MQLRAWQRWHGIRYTIPHKRNTCRRRPFDRGLSRERDQVERLINRLKQFRRVAPTMSRALAGSGGGGTRSCAGTRRMQRSGRQSAGSSKTHNGWSRRIVSGYTRTRRPVSKTGSTHSWASFAVGSPASLTAMPAEGVIDQAEFEPRVSRLRDRVQHLEEPYQHLVEASAVEEELRLMLGRLDLFAAQVREGLHQGDFQTRRDIIRALVNRVEVDTQQIRIIFRVSPTSLPPSSEGAPHPWQHYGSVFWRPVFNLLEDEERTLVLVNPQHFRAVPGRKTDVKACSVARRPLAPQTGPA